MNWMLSIWVAAAVLALCGGENSEGNSLSASGYHLCIYNETRNVTFLVMHKVPYPVTKPCGDWLLLKTCTVTLYNMTHQTEYKTVVKPVTRCCEGYVQVGRYCALPVNRSDEFTAKPGSCPTADGLYPGFKACEWDIDCPGWQKCCQRSGRSLCSDPASFANYSENGGYRFNATVTVKTDYDQLMSMDRGLLNHTRLIHAMVTGALQSNVSVYYLSSWPVHPYRAATSLLIDCDFTVSLYNVTSKLHLLLKHIQEVSSVTVEDVNECKQSHLHQCSPQAECNNTVGSYHCFCRQGYVDVEPSNPGAHCRADVNVSTTTESLLTFLPPMNTTYTPPYNTTQDPPGNSTTDLFSLTETSITVDLSNTSSVPYNSSQDLQWTSSAPHTSMSSTVDSTVPATTCPPPSITSLWLANVTGTSFCVYWSDQLQKNQTYQVVVTKGSEVIYYRETNQTMEEVSGLQPGMLYNVTVTPCACGNQGNALHISVRTDAQTLDATARLTNIQFTTDLQNSSSPAYRNLSESITDEIYQNLSPEMKAMIKSGQMRIEIRGFSPGSVVVNFTLIFTPSQSQDISNVSMAVLHSLTNSTKYTVDTNNTSIIDFNECASGVNDCSQWATCINTWASYTCVCSDGFIDNDPGRPGRACQEITPLTSPMTPTMTTTLFPTVSVSPFSQIAPTTSDPALITVTTTSALTTVVLSTSEVVSTTVPPTTLGAATSSVTKTATPVATTTSFTAATAPPSATTTAAPTIISVAPTTITTAPTTNITAFTTTTAAPVTTIAHTTTPKTTITAPTTTITHTTAPTIITVHTTATATTNITAQTTTTTAPMITTPASTTTSTAPMTTTSAPTTTITAPSVTTPALTTTPTSTTITTTAPKTTITAPAMTTTAPTTTATAPTTTTSSMTTSISTAATTAPTTTITPMMSMTSTPTTVVTSPTTIKINTTAPRSTTSTSMPEAISVECRIAAITVTIARDFLQSTNIRESALYLGLAGCGVNGGNATHVQLTVAWNECATQLVHNETHYTATVTLFNTMDQYTSSNGTKEAPKIRLEVPIMCAYVKSMLISADFGSMGYDMMKDVIMGFGSFQVTVQLMNGTMPLPHNYSLSPAEAVVVEVSLNTSSEHIKVVINKCWATPTQSPIDTNSHIFLENSCPLNAYTKVLMNGNSSTSRVSVQIFSFVNLNVIYLHCQVQICVEIGSDTCVPDCLQRTARSSNTIGTAFGSSGPLLKSDEESLEDEYNIIHIIGLSCLGIGLMLIFIVGFVCLFYYQRNRIGHYNFSVKPKQENFTYLVFNT